MKGELYCIWFKIEIKGSIEIFLLTYFVLRTIKTYNDRQSRNIKEKQIYIKSSDALFRFAIVIQSIF